MPKSLVSSIDPEMQISRLERKRSGIAMKIEEIDRHHLLTPKEQLELLQLKKEKLMLRDSIESLKTMSMRVRS